MTVVFTVPYLSSCAKSQVLIEEYLTLLVLTQLTYMDLDDLAKINKAGPYKDL